MSADPLAPAGGPRQARRVRGPVAALGLIVVILLTAALAWLLHLWNLRARDQARRAAEAAEAADTAARAVRRASEDPPPAR